MPRQAKMKWCIVCGSQVVHSTEGCTNYRKLRKALLDTESELKQALDRCKRHENAEKQLAQVQTDKDLLSRLLHVLTLYAYQDQQRRLTENPRVGA